jgi:glucuronate isomerase
MKHFMDENFLLHSKTAEILYQEFAKDLPVIDYHCHLPPDEIAENRQFANLTKIWLDGDHYKWRAMRANGIPEEFCTGNASDEQKFIKWAETVPYTLRNPLYHWTHLELKRYFGIETILDPSSASQIYREAGKKLNTGEYRVQSLLKKMNVEVVCTTDDPIDSLEHHQKIKAQNLAVKVLPTWRADKALAIENPQTYNPYLNKLSEVSGIDISNYSDLILALRKRQSFFNSMGCRLSDHGLETFYAEDFTISEVEKTFAKVRSGKKPDHAELLSFKSALLYELAVMDHELGWAQQFHIGVLRNNNSRMFSLIGPDKGFDSIGDFEVARPMAKFFDKLESSQKLTKTIVYNLNPRDNELIATMIGNFNDGSFPGKMQFGSGWWFLDQKDGMEKQMNALSSLGLLSRFVGMLTDSRSFMSFPRHEYFRRILCNMIGKDVENGELPNDIKLLGKMVQDISYFNAREFFGLGKG